MAEHGVKMALGGKGIRVGIYFNNSTADIDRLVVVWWK